jgi:hypothetical protein
LGGSPPNVDTIVRSLEMSPLKVPAATSNPDLPSV